ncbi:hypothetical protein H9P43_002517 [Blastocladiella emersonii ATCC 22665]|nr:hypothetical protein H9P43_002517 [Blastocladiella emersonii ATCC 22665]
MKLSSPPTYRDVPAGRGPYGRVMHLFDFDDNVFHMPTPILLFNAAGEPFRISTGAYAVLKSDEQRALRDLAAYHVRFPDSLLEFAELPADAAPGTPSYYLRDLCAALGITTDATTFPAAPEPEPEPDHANANGTDLPPRNQYAWQGPLWSELVHALATDPDNVWIVTARLHRPETIHAGLTFLHRLGLLPAVPHVSRIWPVAHAGFAERFAASFPAESAAQLQLPGPPHTHWSTFKAVLLSSLFRRFAAEANGGAATLCKFSDDDRKNIDATLKFLPSVLAAIHGGEHTLDVQVYSTAASPPAPTVTLLSTDPAVTTAATEYTLPQLYHAVHPRWSTAHLRVNTSNKLKQAEFGWYLAPHVASLTVDTRDMPEPASDPITIMRYKATSVGAGVICDDTSLEIPDAAAEYTGTHIRWAGSLDRYAGSRALFVSMLGLLRDDGTVAIYRGEVWGTIAAEDTESHARTPYPGGFLPYFVPDGGDGKSLAWFHAEGADYRPHNARWYAVQDLLHDKPYMVCARLDTWDGPFQAEDAH